MRITEHQLRRIIRVSLNEDSRPTIGAVLDAIEAIQGAETAAAKKAKLKAIAKKVGWEAVKFIPVLAGLPAVGSIINNAKKAGDVYKLAKKTPDEKVAKDNAVLDLLDIDDQYQLMLDDALEAEFDKEAIEKLNSMPRDALLPDMTANLEKWVKDKYQRGIEGAITENRMRVTKRQLRKIIKEAIMADAEGGSWDVWPVEPLDRLKKYFEEIENYGRMSDANVALIKQLTPEDAVAFGLESGDPMEWQERGYSFYNILDGLPQTTIDRLAAQLTPPGWSDEDDEQ